MKTAAVYLPIDAQTGSRDRYAVWPIDATSLIAFVADAPNAAKIETGRMIERHLAERIKGMETRIRAFLNGNQGGAVAQFLADLVTSVNDYLVTEGRGECYAAGVFVLVSHGEAKVIKVGDCAAYFCGNDQLLRLSETTRLGGSCNLGLLSAIPESADHYEEGVYMGARPRIYTAADVETVSTDGYSHLALLTDGGEKQAGTQVLARILVAGGTLEDRREKLEAAMTKDPPMDDVTAVLLALPVFGTAPPAPPENVENLVGVESEESPEVDGEVSEHLNVQFTSLESQVARIDDRLNIVESQETVPDAPGINSQTTTVSEVQPSMVSKLLKMLLGLLLLAVLTYVFVHLSLTLHHRDTEPAVPIDEVLDADGELVD